MGDLETEEGDSASALKQYDLLGVEAAFFDKGVPGGEPGARKRGGLVVGKVGRCEGEGLLGEFTFRGVPIGDRGKQPVAVGASVGTPNSGIDVPPAPPASSLGDAGTGQMPA